MSSRWEKLPVLTESNVNEWSGNKSELNQAKEKEKADAIAKGAEKVNDLQKEIRINQLIDDEYKSFEYHLLTDTKPIETIRRQRNLSMEKMKDRKLRINSYGETCELDLKTGKIYYIEKSKRIEVLQLSVTPILKVSPEDFSLVSSDLYRAFWKMNIINRALCHAKFRGGKAFSFGWGTHFKKGLFIDTDGGSRRIMSVKWLRKWFGNEYEERAFLVMFNKLLYELYWK